MEQVVSTIERRKVGAVRVGKCLEMALDPLLFAQGLILVVIMMLLLLAG